MQHNRTNVMWGIVDMWPADSVLVSKYVARKAILTAPVSSRRVDILPLSKLENIHTVLQLSRHFFTSTYQQWYHWCCCSHYHRIFWTLTNNLTCSLQIIATWAASLYYFYIGSRQLLAEILTDRQTGALADWLAGILHYVVSCCQPVSSVQCLNLPLWYVPSSTELFQFNGELSL